jgi:hypothetical protein
MITLLLTTNNVEARLLSRNNPGGHLKQNLKITLADNTRGCNPLQSEFKCKKPYIVAHLSHALKKGTPQTKQVTNHFSNIVIIFSKLYSILPSYIAFLFGDFTPAPYSAPCGG